MFNKKFKLIVTAIGLVAVLAMVLAVPGVTQQAGPLPTRSQIVNGLNQALATLTASGGPIWNPDAAVLFSTDKFTGAFVPLAKEDFERSEKVLAEMLRGKPGSAPLGALYVGESVKVAPDFLTLDPGVVYRLVAVTADKVQIVDGEGNVKALLPMKATQVAHTTPTKSSPEVRTNQSGFEIEVGPNCVEVCIIVIIIVITSGD